MKTSDAINELATALAKAQGSISAASKDSSNPYFGRTYASLASVMDACRKPLSDNGLSIVQPLEFNEHGILITTRLMHSSGQFIESSLLMPVEKNTAQATGSAATYGRRYGLASMVGVCPEDDDDGNAATAASPKPRQTSQDAPAASKSQSVLSETPKPATAPPEPPKAKTATKKASNVYTNAKKAIETATDFERLDALTELLGVRWQERALTDEQSVELQELINKQRDTLATAASSLFPAGLPDETPAEVPHATA